MDENKSFGEVIREAREQRKIHDPNYTLRQLAKRVGISPTLLSQVENDEFPPPKAETVIRLAEALDIDQSVLLTKANRLDPTLQRIVTQRQQELASFLRTADGLSGEQLRLYLDRMAKNNRGGNGVPES